MQTDEKDNKKLSIQHEAFCRAIVYKGLSAAKAYAEIYPENKAARQAAALLMRKQGIKDRIAEMLKEYNGEVLTKISLPQFLSKDIAIISVDNNISDLLEYQDAIVTNAKNVITSVRIVTLKPDLNRDQKTIIQTLKFHANGSIAEIGLYNTKDSFERVGRIYGFIADSKTPDADDSIGNNTIKTLFIEAHNMGDGTSAEIIPEDDFIKSDD